MKSQLINTFIAIIFTVVSVYATSTDPSITPNGPKSFVIKHTDWSSSFVDILITNDEGTSIYSNHQVLDRSKKYSLENLAPGNYVVSISNEIKTVKNNITITRKGMFIDFQADTTYKPIFNLGENNIDVNYLSAGKDTKIYIKENQRVLYQTNVIKKEAINKRFDMSNLPSGDYSIVVSNKTGSYSKTFSK